MRINLFGGPGCGKSTLAAYLFAEMKMNDMSVELVTEFVKMWAYQKRVPKPLDQIYIMAKQLNSEYTMLSRGVKIIITDSPLLLTSVYSAHYGGEEELGADLAKLSSHMEKHYPSLNVIIDRSISSKYNEVGRFQEDNQLEELDKIIKDKVYATYPEESIIEVQTLDNKPEILSNILEKIKELDTRNGVHS